MVAIDDVRLLPNCSSRRDRFCDFEEDMCGYEAIASQDVVWTRVRGSHQTTDQ